MATVKDDHKVDLRDVENRDKEIIKRLCNFLAPGIWGAMNSLGAGGAQTPFLVNAGNALTFCLMVVTCFFTSVIVRRIGIKWTLILGTCGYTFYAAGLYTNNRFDNKWFVLVGAALCGLSAGMFWSSEAAIALSYPEPYNQGRFLGYWLSFRLGGQIIGGAGLNANNNQAGKVSYTVYLIFIVLQALAPFAGLLLNNPWQVQRTDGVPVKLNITEKPLTELKSMVKLFFSKKFLLIIPLIAQAVYSESVMFTYQALWFSVRARALGSFLSGVVAIISGNILGAYLDHAKLKLKTRARWAFFVILGLQGCWWIWMTVLVTEFRQTRPTYDWVDDGFGRGFALFLFLVIGFQLQYMFLFFVCGNLADDQEEVIRISGLLRGTESAAQAVSYGLNSVNIFAEVGGTYINFGLWAFALLPSWLIVKEIGVSFGDKKVEREKSSGVVANEGASSHSSDELAEQKEI
ncbi:DUF895 domain membrane protein [Dendrothele bispora CBS 962.96]|uniref:DUF895 domain membrane protein n=1 Tax=Dendrothele bispora (strain CBS 962.96) TaxID=1314807 RepID=A0A4S8KWH7_DENBC|nr:DUF895 domain membrane protein [Dendrothele bispora CBS 962.96]